MGIDEKMEVFRRYLRFSETVDGTRRDSPRIERFRTGEGELKYEIAYLRNGEKSLLSWNGKTPEEAFGELLLSLRTCFGNRYPEFSSWEELDMWLSGNGF